MGDTHSKVSSEPILKSIVIYNVRDTETPIIVPQLEPKNRLQASQTDTNEKTATTQTDLKEFKENSVQSSVDTSTISVQTERQARDTATQTYIPSRGRSEIDTESTSKTSEKLTFTIKKITFRTEKGTPHVATPNNEAEVKAVPGVLKNLKQPPNEVCEVIKQIQNIRQKLNKTLEMLNNNGDLHQLSSDSLIKLLVSSPKVHQMKQQNDSTAENKPNQEFKQELDTHKSNKHDASPYEPKYLPQETIINPTCITETTEEASGELLQETDQNIMSSSSIDAQDLVINENNPKKDPSPSSDLKENITHKSETTESAANVQDLLPKEGQTIISTTCLKTAPENSEELATSADSQEGSSTAQLVPEEIPKPTKEKKGSAFKRMKRVLAKPLRRIQNFATPTCLKGTSSNSGELLPSGDPNEGSSNGQLSQPITPTACPKSPSEAASGDPQLISSPAIHVPQNNKEK